MVLLHNHVKPEFQELLRKSPDIIPPAFHSTFSAAIQYWAFLQQAAEMARDFRPEYKWQKKIGWHDEHVWRPFAQTADLPSIPPVLVGSPSTGENLMRWHDYWTERLNNTTRYLDIHIPLETLPFTETLDLLYGPNAPNARASVLEYLMAVDDHQISTTLLVPTRDTKDTVNPNRIVEYCNAIFEMAKRAYYYSQEPAVTKELRTFLITQLGAIKQDLESVTEQRDYIFQAYLDLNYGTDYGANDNEYTSFLRESTDDFFRDRPAFWGGKVTRPKQPESTISPTSLFHIKSDFHAWLFDEFRFESWYVVMRNAFRAILLSDLAKMKVGLVLKEKNPALRKRLILRQRELSDVSWKWLTDLHAHINETLESIYHRDVPPARLERPILDQLQIQPRGFSIDGKTYYQPPTPLTADDMRLLQTLRDYIKLTAGMPEPLSNSRPTATLTTTPYGHESFTTSAHYYKEDVWSPKRIGSLFALQELMNKLRNDGLLMGTNPVANLSSWQAYGLAERL